MSLWKYLCVAFLIASLGLAACGGDDDDDDGGDPTAGENAVGVCESLDELDEALASLDDLSSESPDSELLATRQAIEGGAVEVGRVAPESASDAVLDLVESVEALALVADQLDLSDIDAEGFAAFQVAADDVAEASDGVRTASDCPA